jgi:tRNA (adenine58-N1)-methyltransferase non-catalytic subunit
LCTYFLAENAQKTMEMRVDTLSQMMSFANVHAGARFIVCEETQGLILGSVMERMGGVGEVLVVHEKEKERHIVAEYMNFGKEWETVNYLHYSRLGPHPDEGSLQSFHHL